METPIGRLPRKADLNLEGLKLGEHALDQLLQIDEQGWAREFDAIADYLDEFGGRTPPALRAEAARIAALLPQRDEQAA